MIAIACGEVVETPSERTGAPHSAKEQHAMSSYPNETRWNQLDAMIARAMPDDGWTLRELDEMSAIPANRRFVQAVVGRDGIASWSQQVFGTGETAEDAVEDAIRTARRYPSHVSWTVRDRLS